MPLIRKRRADQVDPDATDSPRPNHRSRPREEPEPDSPDADMSDHDAGAETPSGTDAMVKKLVRLALASEYARLPIRRADIRDKVLGEQGSRPFNTVFDSAQDQLRSVFGMEMSELPAREKLTVTQRRAAMKSEKPSTASKSWIVTTTLPPKFRTPDILTPARAPSSVMESTYTALYSFIIAVISLNGGVLGEQKLTRYLGRMNADMYTPVDRTEKLLARLCREGYIVRNREMDGGEEVIEYLVGPRGKVEVGTTGVAGLVREVYGYGRVNGGDQTQTASEERENFEARLSRSLGITNPGEQTDDGNRENGAGSREHEPVEPRRSSRRGAQESDDDEE